MSKTLFVVKSLDSREADRSLAELTAIRDTSLLTVPSYRPPRFRSPRNDAQLSSQGISQRSDEREFRPHPERIKRIYRPRSMSVASESEPIESGESVFL